MNKDKKQILHAILAGLVVGAILIFLIFKLANYNYSSSEDISCPQSCDDNIQCTIDSCGKWTNFECKHEPEDCNDYNSCTIDSCSTDTGTCIHQINEKMSPCCGDSVCEPTENYFNCQKDCQLKKEDCIGREKDGTFIRIHSACKDYQILECKKNSACFFDLAFSYKDGELCEYIDYTEGSQFYLDLYWYCKAVFVYGRSACAYVKDDYYLEQCLKYAK